MSDTTDFTLARNKMVDGQIRPARVSDPRVIAAMRSLPRELFVPREFERLAYIDTPIELGDGRTVMEPRVLARLIQLAAPRRGERALVVGANTGYGAALLAIIGLHVIALEENEKLLSIARWATASAHAQLSFRQGRLVDGDPEQPPFDIVLVEGGVEVIPPPIQRLVAAGCGRLVTVLLAGAAGQGVIGEHSVGGLRMRPHFDAAARLLPGFGKPAGFHF